MARFPKGYVKPTDSCESCLAWGNLSGRLCPTCYMFGRSHDAATCASCRRIQPLKWNCRLCWCQARLSAKAVAGQPADETDVRDRLAAVRHHQLFFVGMHYRRRPTPSARRRGGQRGAPRKPPPAPAWRPDPGWRQLPLFEQIPLRERTSARSARPTWAPSPTSSTTGPAGPTGTALRRRSTLTF
ncbi:hypothetical protein GCM10010340_60680 [Streptomyces griseoloalbus]|nr:hypothetical protein GCM10010340_60680 [Streptomyces albaduncus]